MKLQEEMFGLQFFKCVTEKNHNLITLSIQASQDQSLSSLQKVYSENGRSVASRQWMLL